MNESEPVVESILDAHDEWTKRRTITVGDVHYDDNLNVVFLKTLPDVEEYEVPLERCKTSFQVLDWIYQLNEKSWCDGQKLKNFLECLAGALATKDKNVRRLPCQHDLES